MKYSVDFLRKCDGVECFLEIDSGRSGRGIITVEHNDVYVCQNFVDGSTCSNRRGYRWSYVVNSMGQDWFLSPVKNLEIFPTVRQCYDLKIAIKCTNSDQYRAINDATGSTYRVDSGTGPFETFIKRWGKTSENNTTYAVTPGWFENEGNWETKVKAELTIPFENVIFEEMKKQLVGYKLLIDLPDVKKGSLFTPTTEMWMDHYPFYKYINELGDHSPSKYTEPFLKDHPDWFEPSYEIVKPKIVVEDYTMTRDTVTKEHVRFGCVTVDTGHLSDAYHGLKSSIVSGDREISGVYLSNGTKISLDKIKEILDY